MRLESNCGTATHATLQPTSASHSHSRDVGCAGAYSSSGRPGLLLVTRWTRNGCSQAGRPPSEMGSLRECICTSGAGGREDLEWARLLQLPFCCCCIPRDSKAVNMEAKPFHLVWLFEPSPSWTSGLRMNERGKLGGVRWAASCGAWYTRWMSTFILCKVSVLCAIYQARGVGTGRWTR